MNFDKIIKNVSDSLRNIFGQVNKEQPPEKRFDGLTENAVPKLTIACAMIEGLKPPTTFLNLEENVTKSLKGEIDKSPIKMDILTTLIALKDAGHNIIFVSRIPDLLLAENLEEDHLEEGLIKAGVSKKRWDEINPGSFITSLSKKHPEDIPQINILIDRADNHGIRIQGTDNVKDWRKGIVERTIEPEDARTVAFLDAVMRDRNQDIDQLVKLFFEGDDPDFHVKPEPFM